MSENVAAAGHEHFEAGEHEAGHPGPGLYAIIAVALVILTLMELAVYYVSFLQPLLVPILILLAIAIVVAIRIARRTMRTSGSGSGSPVR